ncbi:MAG: rod shape-determining protein MreC [Candidatus Doudnabacteria bacterium]|nr:rod shape-determining protein MreC [Candidatus Doudnabacteria bacterium]
MRFIYTKAFQRSFAIFALVSLFIIASLTGFLNPVKSGILKAYGASVSTISDAGSGIKTTFKTLFLIKKLSSENDQLTQKVDELSFENARLKAAKQENAALRRALNFEQESSFDLIPVAVKISDPTGFTQTIVVDKGRSSQITEGSSVIASPGLLVGKVTRVYSTTSEVTLITDPSLTVNAFVAESGALGLLSGEHGLSLKFNLITHNELIKTGDQLVTSGLSGDFPRGLLVGEVSSVSSSSSDLFQKAYVSPSADLRNLRFLFVIKQ